jgi:hypothetical protein
MVILIINAIDFLFRGKKRRGEFLYLEQHGLKNYLSVNLLLVIGFVLLAVSWFWKPAESPFHICMASWFIWINIYAIIKRRKKINK